jgi:hypothetical protein
MSILFIATIIGTLFFLAILITSIVYGWIPSIAETTKIMISVHEAPLTRMFTKASWLKR